MKKKLALILCAALMLQPAACFAESTTVSTEEAVADEENAVEAPALPGQLTIEEIDRINGGKEQKVQTEGRYG